MLTADSQIIVYLDLFPHSIEIEARVRATAYMVSAYMDTPGNKITVETHFIDRLSRGFKFNNRWHRNEILYSKQMYNYHLNAIKTIIYSYA